MTDILMFSSQSGNPMQSDMVAVDSRFFLGAARHAQDGCAPSSPPPPPHHPTTTQETKEGTHPQFEGTGVDALLPGTGAPPPPPPPTLGGNLPPPPRVSSLSLNSPELPV